MGASISGEREIALGYERFPEILRQRLRARLLTIVERLQGLSREAAPYKTGELRSEIIDRVYADNPQRVAAYVQVVAPDSAGYRKAGALEYGVHNVRRRLAGRDLSQRLSSDRIRHRLSADSVRQRAFRYLRGPLEEMRPGIEAELADVVATSDQVAP